MDKQLNQPIQLILVDDNDANAAAISRACEGAGIEVRITHFHTGRAALAALQGPLGVELQTRPFLILLDLDLPECSGLAFLDALRADPTLRRSIVFTMSHSTSDEDKAAAYDRRVAGYLVKDTLTNNFDVLCDLLDVYDRSIQFPV